MEGHTGRTVCRAAAELQLGSRRASGWTGQNRLGRPGACQVWHWILTGSHAGNRRLQILLSAQQKGGVRQSGSPADRQYMDPVWQQGSLQLRTLSYSQMRCGLPQCGPVAVVLRCPMLQFRLCPPEEIQLLMIGCV